MQDLDTVSSVFPPLVRPVMIIHAVQCDPIQGRSAASSSLSLMRMVCREIASCFQLLFMGSTKTEGKTSKTKAKADLGLQAYGAFHPGQAELQIQGCIQVMELRNTDASEIRATTVHNLACFIMSPGRQNPTFPPTLLCSVFSMRMGCQGR